MMWKLLGLLAFVAALTAGGPTRTSGTDGIEKEYMNDALREQCKQNGAEDKFEEVKKAMSDYLECLKWVYDMKKNTKDVQDAVSNNTLDEVVKKYCDKTPELKTCIHTAVPKIAQCIEPAKREQMLHAMNATDITLDYLCYKDGERITTFLKEGGLEWIQTKGEATFLSCADSVKQHNFGNCNCLSVEKQCSVYDEMTSCLLTSLKGCSSPTPANMAEAFFKVARDVSYCPKK